MYNSYFHLHTSPFGTSPDPRFLYMMPHTREALACLEYGISARKGFTVLTGEVGTGKTTLLKRALASFRGRRIATSFVFNPRLEVLDFLEFVLTDFGITPATRTKSGMLLQLNRWLIERYRMDETCVVVVDEAQNLSWELLEEIRLLTNLETSSEKLLQIVLSGQPELEEKLRHPSVRQLRQRVALWCRTQALTENQTSAYVTERLRLAGAASPIFTPEALALVHRYSRGIPRIINLLCEHSLIVAYVEQVQQVTEAIVEGVAVELELETQPFLISSAAMGGRGAEPIRGMGGDSHGLVTAFEADSKGRQDR
ncbi:MAG: AAA family ATPase [Acidobacteria bacterium]|nr:AAA family ATPase [Acidobacteriota bacterium]